MSLATGTRLGPYEIQSPIGAGGMGEVYKARDTRLNRTVALKVLPPHLRDNPEWKQRFDREGQAVAALEHPHICVLHDIGHDDGVDFLVMEYLEGETLAQRLEKGALPLDRALNYAIQIADALDKAHRAGIVHRDLKPGNVMLTKAGVKLLDFGLAKLRPNAAVSGLSVAATATNPLTGQGTILGTLHYMAPEQLEGKEADACSDIFAFGAVTYEMLTGRKAFEGKSQASVIGAILEREPVPLSTLQPLAPPALDRVVSACLAKDPADRWQSTRDLQRELKWVRDSDTTPTNAGTARGRSGRHAPIAWIVAGAAVLGMVIVGISTALYVRRDVPEPAVWKMDVVTPPTGDPLSFALSPDGRKLAYVASMEGVPLLWVRPLDQTAAQALPGTQGASFPFWAPDGRAIGFFADAKLKRTDLTGGTPQVLADAPLARGGTWSCEGIIAFAGGAPFSLTQVSASGGMRSPLTRFAPGQFNHRWPQFLPDGHRFLFYAASAQSETRGVYLGSLDGREPTRVMDTELAAFFAPPAWLLTVRQGTLMAWRFDLADGTTTGEPVPIAPGIASDLAASGSAITVSAAGVLAYRAGAATSRRQLVWVDRAGKGLTTVAPPDESGLISPEIAPDGRRVAVVRTQQQNIDVWLLDADRGVPSRFTFDPSIDSMPVWSSDGRRVVFRSNRNKGVYDLFEKPTSGLGDEQPLLVSANDKTPMDWSSDGRTLLYATQNPKTQSDLWALSLGAPLRQTQGAPSALKDEPKPVPVVQTSFDETAGQFSPAGQWIAYQSNESGRYEVYVRTFPESGGKWLISAAGGSQPRWRRDGKELFYIAADGRVMAVPIAVTADRQALAAGAPVPLFASRLATGGNIFAAGFSTRAQYAVAPDGRFLMNVGVDDATSSPIAVVLNWEAGLKNR